MRPVSEEESSKVNMNSENPKWTICEVIRTTYRLADGIDNPKLKEEIKLKMREAAVLANRISNKLREYKEDYDKEGWWTNKND